MLFTILDDVLPIDLSNIIVSYLSYQDIIIMLPEIHRIYTDNVDDYNLMIPYHPFRNMIWEWRLNIYHDTGIRIRAHSILGGTIDKYPWVISGFLPYSHCKCAIGFRDILKGGKVNPLDLNFILTHWREDLFNYMATEVMNKNKIECLRSGCGIVLGAILREIKYNPLLRELTEWTDVALRDYSNVHFGRCVHMETDALYPITTGGGSNNNRIIGVY